MVKYYSQHGEDALLSEIFKNKKNGFFVEVGCIDGKRFSNTLTFEERGWEGICVEAHAGYIELIKQNRPHSIVCHCAAGEKDEEDVTFFANSRGSLSTLDKSRESYFKENFGVYFTGFEEQHVKKRRLDSLFHEHGVGEIDFISLDVEGGEIEVLTGIDLKKYQPGVFVIESDSPEHEALIDELLIPNGYTKSVRIAQNIFYLLYQDMEEEIKAKKFEVELIHTQHPLDDGGDIRTKVIIDTNEKDRWLRRLISKMLK